MGNNTGLGQLTGVMARDLDMLIGLMIHWIEDHRNNTSIVDINRDRSGMKIGFQLFKERDKPLRFLGTERQSGVLGMIGASRHIGTQLAVPRDN